MKCSAHGLPALNAAPRRLYLMTLEALNMLAAAGRYRRASSAARRCLRFSASVRPDEIIRAHASPTASRVASLAYRRAPRRGARFAKNINSGVILPEAYLQERPQNELWGELLARLHYHSSVGSAYRANWRPGSDAVVINNPPMRLVAISLASLPLRKHDAAHLSCLLK